MKKPEVKMAHAVRNLFLKDVAEMSEKVIRKALMKIKRVAQTTPCSLLLLTVELRTIVLLYLNNMHC